MYVRSADSMDSAIRAAADLDTHLARLTVPMLTALTDLLTLMCVDGSETLVVVRDADSGLLDLDLTHERTHSVCQDLRLSPCPGAGLGEYSSAYVGLLILLRSLSAIPAGWTSFGRMFCSTQTPGRYTTSVDQLQRALVSLS